MMLLAARMSDQVYPLMLPGTLLAVSTDCRITWTYGLLQPGFTPMTGKMFRILLDPVTRLEMT